MSYIEKFIRGCFAMPKYSPKSFLTAIGSYSFGLFYAFVIVFLGGHAPRGTFRYEITTIFCILALIIIVLDLFGFFIKFWVDSDWPLLIMYLTSIVSLYMVPLFAAVVVNASLKDLVISLIIVTISAPIGWLWFIFIMTLFKIDPMDQPKPHPFLLFGFYWLTIAGSFVSFICTEITGKEFYGVYAATFLMSSFSPFITMHFTRVFDYWQAIPQDGKRYGSVLTTLKAKEKTKKDKS
ncbi:putative membrane protein [Streptococcus intermedius]|uniref:Membrane protein n=1 Tax=Streptococcus intermedius TaxID=1338 RepID=A0AAD1FK27_STRIT|nr:hypothetical protein [Streptococcus intermedius]EKU16796.1 putative membrane protein [Streptococcus intermedius BA1]BAW17492.1 putative membrane protein [Streptococcus intermedius]